MPKAVYVLGAGFTKAFFPDAPLVYDDYPIRDTAAKFANLPAVVAALGAELSVSRDSKFNLERVMTRLSSAMPYESDGTEAAQLRIALDEVETAFAGRLRTATADPGPDDGTFQALAQKCVDEAIDCVTFNYDDAWDAALWRVKSLTAVPWHPMNYWHPDGGYGFFCRPSRVCVMELHGRQDITANRLLKLHGSVNWRLRRGARAPYAPEDIVHRAGWFPTFGAPDGDPRLEPEIERQLLTRPFIVPPVLDKSSIGAEPVLQATWSAARGCLSEADEVTFVGYSFPPTDLAARFLFSEAITAAKRAAIRIVDFREGADARARLMGAYNDVFGQIEPSRFSWDGAVAWAESEVRRAGAAV